MRKIELVVNDNVNVQNDHENFIFMNGYAYGQRAGASELIHMLQNAINDDGNMEDAHNIKMLIYNTWKSIYIDQTNFSITIDQNN